MTDLSSSVVEDILEHHGVRGMKWGQRRAAKKLAKADQKWQKNIYTIHGAIAVHNAVADKMNNGGLDKLNGQSKYKNLNAFDESSPLTKQYFKEYEQLTEKFTRQAVEEVHGTSPSGGYKATLNTSDPSQWKVDISPVEARHASDPFPTLMMELEHDGNIITLARLVKDDMKQSTEDDSMIEHHGVKGMKWGVRTRASVTAKGSKKTHSTDFEVTVPLRNRKTHELSNHEIQTVNTRINLEQNYRRLNPTRVQVGGQIVKGIIGTLGTAASLYTLANSPAGKAAISTGKKLLQKK